MVILKLYLTTLKVSNNPELSKFLCNLMTHIFGAEDSIGLALNRTTKIWENDINNFLFNLKRLRISFQTTLSTK